MRLIVGDSICRVRSLRVVVRYDDAIRANTVQGYVLTPVRLDGRHRVYRPGSQISENWLFALFQEVPNPESQSVRTWY